MATTVVNKNTGVTHTTLKKTMPQKRALKVSKIQKNTEIVLSKN